MATVALPSSVPHKTRLRDVAAAGGIDQLYVHCPDRLARNYAHQVLLLEEFLRAGVEVVFLNREVGQTPEDQLLWAASKG
jgi:site-specific DNA recombinase